MKNFRYFYAENLSANDETVIVRGDEAHHMAVVNRMSIGDECCVINGCGVCCHVVVEAISKKEAVCRVVSVEVAEHAPQPEITVFHAMPRKGTFHEVIEKAVELGANRLVPVISERCMVKVKDAETLQEKHMSIARGSLKQSHRPHALTVGRCVGLRDVASLVSSEAHKFVLHPYSGVSPQECLQEVRARITVPVTVLIGPEGGFSDDEYAAIANMGFCGVRFPGGVMRSETAIAAILALVRYAL